MAARKNAKKHGSKKRTPARATAVRSAVKEIVGAPLYQLLVASVQDYAIFALDRAGRVLTWNPGAERLKGYTTREIIGRHFSVFFPDDVAASGFPDRELEEAAQHGRAEDEGWRVRKDGSRFWANVIITALHDATGEVIGFAKVTRDLTERREYELAQAVADRMTRLQKFTARLAGI